MHITRRLGILFFAVLPLITGLTADADEAPVLAVLEYSGGLFPKRADIRSQTGPVKSPFAEPRAAWTLREGDTLKQEYAPAARYLQFYYQSGGTPQLLCNVVVRYVRGPKGWRPSYLLLQQSPVSWNGEQFMPRAVMSAREPVKIINPTEPAGDRFYHGLSFGLASGATQITAWQVQ